MHMHLHGIPIFHLPLSCNMNVVESAKYIAENSAYVQVVEEKCKHAARSIHSSLIEHPYSTESWSHHPLNPKGKDRSTVDWIFVVDLLNFSFWSNVDDLDTGRPESDRFTVRYRGNSYTGYWSLVAAVNRALDSGIPFTSPEFWRKRLTLEMLGDVFKSDTKEQIPLLAERYQVLKEAGQSFEKLGVESFADLIEQCGHSAVKLVDLIRTNFGSFNDVAVYKGMPVQILKRAQILVSDIWACFNGLGYGHFTDIDQITMFADYRVPQILEYLGCLRYSEELIADLNTLTVIPSGDEREVELRGCSIWAVERIKDYLLQQYPEYSGTVNSVLLDFYLWDYAKQLQGQQGKAVGLPAHRTRSVFY